MYAVSKECYAVLGGTSRRFTAKAAVTLADGSVLSLAAGDFKQGGIKLDEATSQSGSFDLGAAIMSKLTLTLDNLSGKFSTVNFIGGQVSMIQIGVYLSDDKIEWIPLGIFDIDSVKLSGSAAEITAYDLLGRANRDLPSAIQYPISLKNLLDRVCTDCGIPWNGGEFLNGDYIVKSPPQKVTCREVISYIAQLAGCYARMTRGGELELNWYGWNTPIWDAESWLDGGIFTDMTSGDIADGGDFYDYSDTDVDGGNMPLPDRGFCIIRNPKSVEGDSPLTITGVRYIEPDRAETSLDNDGYEVTNTVEGVAYMYGTDDYTFDLSGNPLIQHDVESVLARVGEKLVGDTFSPLSLSCSSNPALEAGDIVRVTDRRGVVHTGYINSCAYKYGATQTLSCDAESAEENQSVSYSAVSKLESKINSAVNEKIDDYNRRVQNLNNLMLNSMGVYKSTVQNSDGSVTYYTHDKPTLEESSYISCETSNGFAYTNEGWNNGAPHWQYGNTKDGNIICNILSAVGITADWIRTGRVESKDGSCYFDLDTGKLVASNGINANLIKADRVESQDGSHYFDLDTGKLVTSKIGGSENANAYVAFEDDYVKLYNLNVWSKPYCSIHSNIVRSGYQGILPEAGFTIRDSSGTCRIDVPPVANMSLRSPSNYALFDASDAYTHLLHAGEVAFSAAGKRTDIYAAGSNAGYNIVLDDGGVSICNGTTVLQHWE